MHTTLRKIRKEQGLTQAEIAKMLGVSRSCVANWEAGTREADILILRKYNELFGYKEEFAKTFRRMVCDRFSTLDLSIFNCDGAEKLMKIYDEMKNDPKYLKNP